MKNYLEKQIADMRAQIEKSDNADEIRSLGAKIEEAKEQLAKLEAEEARNAKPAGAEFNPVATYEGRQAEPAKENKETEAEARANAFVQNGHMVISNDEARAVLVSSGDLVTPTKTAGINDQIGAKVSSIVDLVKVTNASGMGAYKVAYQVTDSEGGAQTEGGEYHAGEPTFDSVEITPQTESIISYISKQARKQTNLNYTEKVNSSALLALRKRASKFIAEKIIASTMNTELTLPAIDATTLRKICLDYGGDESIVGAATLVLNKKDLVKLGDVRGTNEKKALYTITPDASNPNTGVISEGGMSVPYCINNNVPENKLIYGQMHCFEFALFSGYEIAVSEDFKFSSGLLTIRGDVEFGGEVTIKNGFVVATVGA